jgi:eukaryotic-like serine/threonine-protein kinase
VIGTTIGGKYSVVRQLGEGGMGAVYEARHTGTGRRVAVKVITGDLGTDPELAARFELEARAAGAIESEHIAQVLDVGRDDARGAPFLVMEYLVGEDLGRVFERLGPLPPDLVLRIGVQACIGLGMAHAQGIVHRDIKPANMFLAERDSGELRVKIVDFGIAKVQGSGLDIPQTKGPLTRVGTFLGSPLYMSPEQTRGTAGALDHRTDLWSLGIVLYQAIAGRTPFHDITSIGDFVVAVRTTQVTPIRAYAPWTDPAVARAIERCLIIDREGRYQSTAELRAALEAFLPNGSSIRPEMVVAMHPGGVTTMPATPVIGTTPGGAQAPTEVATPMFPTTVPGQPISTPPGPPGTHPGGYGTPHGGYPATPAGGYGMPGTPSGGYGSPATPPGGYPPMGTPLPGSYGAPPVGAPMPGAYGRPSGMPPGPPLPPMAPPTPKPSSGAGPILGIGVGVLLLAGGVAGAFSMGWIGKSKDPAPVVTEAPSASAPPPIGSAERAAALEALVGTWKSDDGVVYDAVESGRSVEMRIRDVDDLASRGYVAGDTHFSLRLGRGDHEPNVYRVFARIRPSPPKGTVYDKTRARTTCESTWRKVGDKDLHAELKGDKIVVHLPKVDAPASVFVREGIRVVGCKGLEDAPATEVEIVLSRTTAPATQPKVYVPPTPKHDAGAPTKVVDAGAPPQVVDAGAPPKTVDAGIPTKTVDAGAPQPGGAVGSPCRRDGHCSSGNCTNRRCQGNETGSRCIHNGHCASRKCIAGACL